MRGKFLPAGLWITALLVVTSLPAHAQASADCNPVMLAEAPMMLASGHVTVPAQINGKVATLGIDTGGPFSSLTIEGFHRLGLVGRRNILRIGDLELHSDYMGVMESFPGVDGLIAPDILSRYDIEFDFGAGMFRLFEHHACIDRAATVIPFTLTHDGHIRVPVTLDGQKTYAILDTGSPISILSMEDAGSMFGVTPDNAGLKEAGAVAGLWSKAILEPYTDPSWESSSKTVSAYSYSFKTMTIGGMPLANPPIKLTEGRNFLERDFATLLLGNDLLSRFRFTIAYREQKLYLSEAGAH